MRTLFQQREINKQSWFMVLKHRWLNGFVIKEKMKKLDYMMSCLKDMNRC